jgi:mevalonate kinase
MHFRAHGKILLTSEYFVIDGAQAIALPTRHGQTMDIVPNNSDSIEWNALHDKNTPWISATFDLKNFNSDLLEGDVLQTLLRAARDLNPDFLDKGTKVTTRLEFPKDWGLGSSSTLISIIAQWAGIDPFDLKEKANIGGSGYDIACAQSQSPILYHLDKNKPTWSSVSFKPSFADSLYFIYLNQKQDTAKGIHHYKNSVMDKEPIIQTLNNITDKIIMASELKDFESLITKHENVIASALNLIPVKQFLFTDYWGAMKSLGAWGGDFILATSNRGDKETFAYFQSRGYNTILKYKDMIL